MATSVFTPSSAVDVRLQLTVLFIYLFLVLLRGASLLRACAVFFFSAVWHREVFHGLGVQDVTDFDSD
jgi:hypothetical protein